MRKGIRTIAETRPPERDEVREAAKQSLQRLKEERYYAMKEFQRLAFNARQECRAKERELERTYRDTMSKLNAEIDAVRSVLSGK